MKESFKIDSLLFVIEKLESEKKKKIVLEKVNGAYAQGVSSINTMQGEEHI